MRLVFPVVDKTLATGVTLPSEMLSAAAQLARAHRRSQSTPVELAVLGETAGVVQVSGGVGLQAQGAWQQICEADAVIIPPIWGNPLPMLARNQELVVALADAMAAGKPVIGTGTAVAFMAETGLMSGRAATTHWSWFSVFERRYAQVLLRTRQTITRDGELYCAASVNALTDLILYFVRIWYGPDIMGIIERHFSHEVRRSIAQPYYWLGGMQHDDEDIVRAQAWLLENLDRNFTLAELAAALRLNVRTLARRFRQATGSSPKQYWVQLRLLRAEELLKDSNLAVQDIALMLGFVDAAHFIRTFRRRAGVTPSRYREVARAKQFSAASGLAVAP